MRQSSRYKIRSCIAFWFPRNEQGDNLSKAGWSWGCVSAIDSEGRTIFVADAHRDGQRFVVRADEKLTAFVELESATRAAESPSRQRQR